MLTKRNDVMTRFIQYFVKCNSVIVGRCFGLFGLFFLSFLNTLDNISIFGTFKVLFHPIWILSLKRK